MRGHQEEAERWIGREDRTCRQDRIERLVWLASLLPQAEYLTFPSGWMGKQLYEEARYSFVYAQFLAAIVLGFAFIEHTLAAMFRAAGRNDLNKARPSVLFQEAVVVGWFLPEDQGWFERVRKLRNPAAHFRPPFRRDTIEYRAVTQRELPYALLEEDARHVMNAVMGLLARGAV